MENSRDFSITAATVSVFVSIFFEFIGGEAKTSMFLAIFFVLAAIYFQLKVMSNEPMD